MKTETAKKEKGVLVDLTRCIGCRGCQVACKSWNERKAMKTKMHGNFTNPVRLNSECFTNIRFIEGDRESGPVWSFVKDQCLHCKDPACVAACPVGALKKTPDGPVVYEYDPCIGCRYCMISCPFDIPKYEWEKALTPWVRKCTFCSERIKAGATPACIKVCPTNVMQFGDRDEVLREAERRLKKNPGRYVNHIYGKEEAGGTNWIYLSGVPFEQIGFKTNIPAIRLPSLTWEYLSNIPMAVGGLAVTLALIAWIRNRGDSSGEAKAGKEKLP